MTQAGLDLSPGQLLRGPRLLGTIAWGLVAITAVVVLTCAVPVIRALTAPGAVQAASISDKDVHARTVAFEGGLVVSDKRIDARAPFGITRPPIAAAPSQPVIRTYGGSPVIGVVNDTVLLADGRRIGVGETAGDVEVLGLDLPWAVRVKWKDTPLTVNLFERATVNLEQPLAAIIGALPYIAPPKVVVAPPPVAPGPNAAPAPAGAPVVTQTTEGGAANFVVSIPPGSTLQPAQPGQAPPPPPTPPPGDE